MFQTEGFDEFQNYLQDCLRSSISDDGSGFVEVRCEINRIRLANESKRQEEMYEAIVHFGRKKRFVFRRSDWDRPTD